MKKKDIGKLCKGKKREGLLCEENWPGTRTKEECRRGDFFRPGERLRRSRTRTGRKVGRRRKRKLKRQTRLRALVSTRKERKHPGGRR